GTGAFHGTSEWPRGIELDRSLIRGRDVWNSRVANGRGFLLLRLGIAELRQTGQNRTAGRPEGDGARHERAPVDLAASKLIPQVLKPRIHPVVLHAPHRQRRRLPRLLPQRRVVRNYAI